MNRKWAMAALALALATGAGREGWAWGATGNDWISGIAIQRLPADPQGLRLWARRHEGRGDGGHARGARLVRGRPAAAREAHAARHRHLEPLRRRCHAAPARLRPYQRLGDLSQSQRL